MPDELPAVRIGCAGLALPSPLVPPFVGEGSRLEKYARVFGVLEINSTFYRSHRPSTFARWRDSVPDGFRFSVKVPGSITHEHRLTGCRPLLSAFLKESGELGPKRGALLVQLAGSHPFDLRVARTFFRDLRRRVDEPIAIEARHESWSTDAASDLFTELSLTRVDAHPVKLPPARPVETDLVYHRLHGHPRVYWSPYEDPALEELAARIRTARDRGKQVFCIFDNTASGAAPGDAMALQRKVVGGPG